MAKYTSCYLLVVLQSEGWLFVYSEDKWRVNGDILHLCVDSRTGDPCDFPGQAPDTLPVVAKCKTHLLSPSLREAFGAESAQARMIDEKTVEVAMWLYRPLHTAIEGNLPTPTPLPDRFSPEYLPTDYAVRRYNLDTGESTPVVLVAPAFADDICTACDKQVLSQSPDAQWQLLAVTQAHDSQQNGIWLLHRSGLQQLVAPVESDAFYKPSETWWRWASDSSGLFLTYWTAGERAEIPLYIKLTLPPRYTRLLQQVMLDPGMFTNHAVAVDDHTALLEVRGPVIRSDGSRRLEQWYVFDAVSGTLRESTTADFSRFVYYLLPDEGEAPTLLRWNQVQTEQWVSQHPDEDIWNTLGRQARFYEPTMIKFGILLIPQVTDHDLSLQVLKCSPVD